jgi:curved DNA-binding protein CbpA
MEITDYYEFLQISPNAEPGTVHRVYRFLAARLHPDNPGTGDAEQFFLLQQAYDVLSSPERRAEYDANRKNGGAQPPPLSETIDFMDIMEGDLNRRLAVLSVLYFRRRTNPYSPEVSLLDLEERMGFPRDYLEFTAWYLRNKGYITRADNSDFTLTAEGVDFVETQRENIPLLNKLLTTSTGPVPAGGAPATKALNPSRTPIIVPGGAAADSADKKGASKRGAKNGDDDVR